MSIYVDVNSKYVVFRKKPKTRKVNIRYIKSGSIYMNVPDELTGDKLAEYCTDKMEYESHSELKHGLSDFSESSDDFFDETPIVECISDSEYNPLYKTKLWECYEDPEAFDNIVYENKAMANYLKNHYALSQDKINDLCSGSIN